MSVSPGLPGLPGLVVFDMAGTTVRDEGGQVNRCLRAALERAAGVAVSEDAVNAVMGLPKPEALRVLLGPRLPDPRAVVGLVETAHADFLARMAAHYRDSPEVAPVPGAEDTFARLRAAGVRVALDTGFDRATAAVILNRFGWRDGGTIDGSVTSDEVERGRPHPDMVLALMRRFGVTEPSRVAKIGDTPSDLQEGMAACCGWVVGVCGGSHSRSALAAHPHTHLLATVADLPALWGL